MEKILPHLKTTFVLLIALATVLSTGCAPSRYSRSTGTYIDDKANSARVKAALFDDPMVSGFQVGVQTYRGDVQLTGFVNTEAERQRAVEIARGVNGVRMVTNNIDLKPAPAQAVGTPGSTTYQQSGAAGSASVGASGSVQLGDNTTPASASRQGVYRQPAWQLDASNGRAVLRGTVQSDSERDAIERRVRDLPGVTTVDNQIEIRRPNQ